MRNVGGVLCKLQDVRHLNSFLKTLDVHWKDFCNETIMIRNIFLYLDRSYVLTKLFTTDKSIWDVSLKYFRQTVIENHEIEQRIEKIILEMIDLERSGEIIDKFLLIDIVQMYLALGIYDYTIEKKIIEGTKLFYQKESDEMMEQLTVVDYMMHVEKRLRQEMERADIYFAGTNATKKLILSAVDEKMISAYSEQILEKGFEPLVYDTSTPQISLDHLSRMYRLLERVGRLSDLCLHFTNYIKKVGFKMINCDVEKDKTLVKDILELKNRMDVIYKQAFRANESFSFDYKAAFEKFVNSNSHKVAELIAKFLDQHLRSGKTSLSDRDLEQVMNEAMTIFKFVEGKDVFEAFYKKDLAKRLLLNRSSSEESEKLMISKLKTECGSGFTNKLEGMFKDVYVSRELMEAFKASEQAKKLGSVELFVTVITTGTWPPYQLERLVLPKECAKYQEIFADFYLKRHTGRLLKWQNSMGHSALKANYPKGKKEIEVSLFQATVLLLFNDFDQLTFKEIQLRTQMDEKELSRTLQSLALVKESRLLLRVGPSSISSSSDSQTLPQTSSNVVMKDNVGEEEEEEGEGEGDEEKDSIPIADTDNFLYNQNFHHKLMKIKINSVQIKETVEEKSDTHQKIQEERRFTIDAAIVRIMKSKKKMSHNSLINEVFSQLKFPMKNADIKKRIESLIERDYLVRNHEGTESFYVYQA